MKREAAPPPNVDAAGGTLIESDRFPFEFVSGLAERESWRKEIHRPVHHLHKWWATRLGSVFRGILLGAVLPPQADLEREFHREHRFAGRVVFDPFLGSGITVGEAHKLGFAAFGRDINPVAAEAVRVALGPIDRRRIQLEFERLERSVGSRIQELYSTQDELGKPCVALYYFWVKQADCPECGASVDLFRSRVIGRNAFPDKKPLLRLCCPGCGDMVDGMVGAPSAACLGCGLRFDPLKGNARGSKASCPACVAEFSIIKAIRAAGGPPRHRLVGKLVLRPDGEKRYLPATDLDRTAYGRCGVALDDELTHGRIAVPNLALAMGHNTKQALNYGYGSWRLFFNDRQLLALGWLHRAIAEVEDEPARDALLALFSATLEFNNLFASYKGEGTGAVRHMFSHHILKPERQPLEANVWGTPKSSGAFSTLYKSRLLRTIAYRRAPTEISSLKSSGPIQCSPPFSGEVSIDWPPSGSIPPRAIFLSCGSSDRTGLAPKSVDLVVTDPPFFDNVHYSELADFFYAWQSLLPRGFIGQSGSTRAEDEVQDKNARRFAAKLLAVFAECHRVLKDDGLLAFSYHHSRQEGWSSLVESVIGAGFFFVNAHPVKAEMSVATPKSQAKEPIQLDVILVCRKTPNVFPAAAGATAQLDQGFARALSKAKRLADAGFRLSRNDRRVILYSQLLAELGIFADHHLAVSRFEELQRQGERFIDAPRFAELAPSGGTRGNRHSGQLSLFG